METKKLIIPKEDSITIKEIMDTMHDIVRIEVYEGSKYKGLILYYSLGKSWFYLEGIDYCDRKPYNSLEELLNSIKIINLNVKVIYND